jgi:hypothetical protein
MTLVGPVQLYQAGDIPEGTLPVLTGFNDLLGAIDVDGIYCAGDDPFIDDVSGPSSQRIPRTPRLRQQTAEQTLFPSAMHLKKMRFCLVFEITSFYKADLTPFYQNRQCNEYG